MTGRPERLYSTRRTATVFQPRIANQVPGGRHPDVKGWVNSGTARVMGLDGQQYDFRYRYYYYFFVARYMRDHISRPADQADLRKRLAEMAEHMHYEEYANILTFYVYLSKDLVAIQDILTNARRVYDDYSPCDFSADVKFVNDLYISYKQPDKLRLPASSPDENRDRYRRELDSAEEFEEGPEFIDTRQSEKLKYNKELSDVIKINIATKTLQLLGQVIRNSPGSVPGDIKREVAAEAYFLGLRTLNAVLRIPENNLEGLQKYITGLVKEHRAARNQSPLLESELRKIADEGVIYLAQAYAHGLLRRISLAVGLKQLEDIYAAVLADHIDKTPVRMIDLAIKLDHFGVDPPIDELFAFEKELRNNYYAHRVLRDLVFSFLCMRQVNYKTRDKLTSRFKIESPSSTLVDNPNKKRLH
jgi:hypothetical protein